MTPHHAPMPSIRSLLAAAALALAASAPAVAAPVIDTGTPSGSAVGAYALDATDFYAGQVAFAQNASIRAVSAHVLGGTAGETFSLALYGDSAAHLPGTELHRATATFGADGWNGIGGLSGWDVLAGTLYWIAVELDGGDILGSGSATGALLDSGAPTPLARTAFNAGSGYQASATQLSFGVQVDADAQAVPEPASGLLVLAALGGMGAIARQRRG